MYVNTVVDNNGYNYVSLVEQENSYAGADYIASEIWYLPEVFLSPTSITITLMTST